MRHSIETFQRMEAIFHEALELPNESRANLIAARCEGDTALIAEVHALLEANEMAEQLSASRRNEQQQQQRFLGPVTGKAISGR